MRYFSKIISVAPKKEQGKQKPIIKELNLALWHKLENLAIVLGFCTDRALKLQKQDFNSKLAIYFLK